MEFCCVSEPVFILDLITPEHTSSVFDMSAHLSAMSHQPFISRACATHPNKSVMTEHLDSKTIVNLKAKCQMVN